MTPRTFIFHPILDPSRPQTDLTKLTYRKEEIVPGKQRAPEPEVITVRMSRSLHQALRRLSFARMRSMNVLCKELILEAVRSDKAIADIYQDMLAETGESE